MSAPLNDDPARARGMGIPRNHSDLQSDRLNGIDAARGFAIAMVCLSHVRYHFDDIPAVYFALTAVTRVATPTFLLLSGFVAAYVLASRREGTRLAVVDRGLFVLLVGHVLLNLHELPEVGLRDWLFARVTVTDAIGICLVIGALCANVAPRLLLIAGLVLAFASWPIANMVDTQFSAGHYLLLVLFDTGSQGGSLIDAAIAPYLGLFLIGMGLSKSWMSLLALRDFSQLTRKLFIVGSVAVATVVITALLWREFKGTLIPLLGSSEIAAIVQQGLQPMQKLPPSPAYLMFYGGGALLVAGICFARRPRAIVDPIANWTAPMGRASLMCFIMQDWLLLGVPALFGFASFSSALFWASYFGVVIFVLQWLARQWDARRANRFLTIGLKSFGARERVSPRDVPARGV